MGAGACRLSCFRLHPFDTLLNLTLAPRKVTRPLRNTKLTETVGQPGLPSAFTHIYTRVGFCVESKVLLVAALASPFRELQKAGSFITALGFRNLDMDSQEGGKSYEDIRKQRLEENKKRMQELGLANLSKNMSSDFISPKTTAHSRQVKPRIPKEFIELRRSTRVAANPAPDYREVDADISLGSRRSYSSYSSRAASLMNRKYASDEARLEAVLQAETIMKELPRSTPSFVKPMLQSHTTGGFWLGLPSNFCKTYLPKKDDQVVLENEKGDEWETVYLANKAGLSGGWRGFSLDHGLVDGDALVFELIEPCRFKIHIVRAYEDAQDDDDTKEDLGKELDTKVETQAHAKKNGEPETPNKSRGKKTQALKETTSEKLKSAKKQQSKGSKGAGSESEGSGQESDKRVRRKKDGNAKKRSLEEDDDIEDLFEIEEEGTTEPNSRSSQITSYMRTGKPRYGRVAKKPMACGDMISVF